MLRDMRVEGVAVETDRPISTRLFRYVERVVCRANQRIAAHDAGMGPPSNSEARRPLDRAAVERECTRLHFFAHPLGECHGGVEYRARKQQHELLAAITSNAVDFFARFVL